ncbi:hypothetical protein KR222_010784, partial [Zaprionus bogoriensis]
MSNLTLLRLSKLQPIIHMVGGSYAALANLDVDFAPNIISGSSSDHSSYSSSSSSNSSNNSSNNSSESNSSNNNFLLLLEENYSYRSTSTIVLMVAAWVLLILGFVFCCCAECFGISVWRGKKRASIALSSIERGAESSAAAAG